jgi:DNA-binding HxlR family transcriptional regulator
MPRNPPRDAFRSFNTRVTGIFKKMTELHDLDELVQWDVVVRRVGSPPQVYTTTEKGDSEILREYVRMPQLS